VGRKDGKCQRRCPSSGRTHVKRISRHPIVHAAPSAVCAAPRAARCRRRFRLRRSSDSGVCLPMPCRCPPLPRPFAVGHGGLPPSALSSPSSLCPQAETDATLLAVGIRGSGYAALRASAPWPASRGSGARRYRPLRLPFLIRRPTCHLDVVASCRAGTQTPTLASLD